MLPLKTEEHAHGAQKCALRNTVIGQRMPKGLCGVQACSLLPRTAAPVYRQLCTLWSSALRKL